MNKTVKSLLCVLLTIALAVPLPIGVSAATTANTLWYGDVTMDGRISAADLTAVLFHLLGLKKLDNAAAARADFNDDGVVNATDLIALLSTLTGLSGPVPFTGIKEEFLMGPFDLVVSPHGCDSWSGRLAEPNPQSTDGPLATIHEAKERLKALKYADVVLGTVTIWLRGGTYTLEKPLAFTAEDLNGCAYKAYPGESPVISGSAAVSGWREDTVNGVNVWVADWDEPGGFNALYNGERRLPRSRFPKVGELSVHSVNASDALNPDSTYFKENLSFNSNPTDIPAISNITDVHVRILHYWKDELIPLESYNPTNGYVRLQKATAMTTQAGDRYFFENVFEALSSPGEWYLHKPEKKVYYVPLPGENKQTTVLKAGQLEQLLSVNAADDLTFERITFRDSDWNIVPTHLENSQAAYGVAPAVFVGDSTRIRFLGCAFRNIGATALKIGLNSQHCEVRGCLFKDIGATGVFIEGENIPADAARVTRDIVVTDNHIYKYGRIFNNAIGVLLIHARECEISQNEIHDGFYTGISAGWVWGYSYNVTDHLTIENNLIYNIGQGWLSDMGGIYTLGIQPNSVIRGNVVHNVGSYGGGSGYGGWGIYLDEGTSYMTVENNIAYNCSSQGFHQHYGRENTVRNNIFAMNEEGQIRVSRKEEHTSIFLTGNIIVSKNATMYTSVEKGKFIDDGNLYWDYQRKSCVLSGNSVKIKDRIYRWGMVCRGYYVNGVFADPLFADIENRDFTLLSNSPAKTIGFNEWDYHRAGTLTAFDVS